VITWPGSIDFSRRLSRTGHFFKPVSAGDSKNRVDLGTLLSNGACCFLATRCLDEAARGQQRMATAAVDERKQVTPLRRGWRAFRSRL
jgi:hypothetical protein